MVLPEDFLIEMKQLLGNDFDAFLASYDDGKISALRINPLKTTIGESGITWDLSPVEWCPNGFYYDESNAPGKHPFHEAGLYYIQDASAMLPAELLAPVPGDYVLDLCAAPGGKSTQLAGKLLGQGLLVSNEPIPSRAKILSENVERMGVQNALVVSAYPDELSERFACFFDKILVDAPCSGEGMFRKNPDAVGEWSLENVKMCAQRQLEILDEAAKMLRPGGRLVYSTCTFSSLEDEKCIAHFLSNHTDFSLIDERRLWPHLIKGEGHYAALLEKSKDSDDFYGKRKYISAAKKPDYAGFLAFAKENLPGLDIDSQQVFIKFGDQLYLIPSMTPDLKGLKVLRPGLHLGTLKKDRFEPSHALALALKASEVSSSYDLSPDSDEIRSYLNGQALPCDSKSGWTLITVGGHSIGWGKASGGWLKNHYPKGLRINY